MREKGFTKQYQKHTPSGYCYLIKFFDDEIFPPKLVRHTIKKPDENIPQMFVENLECDIKEIYNQFKFPQKLRMTMKDKEDYENATHCHICESELGKDKVLNHCHLTGKFRGAAHNECNLQFRIPKIFPVIFLIISPVTIRIYLSRILEHQKVRLTVSQTMRRNTLASQKRSKWEHLQTKRAS